jgi:hypothetical protein
MPRTTTDTSRAAYRDLQTSGRTTHDRALVLVALREIRASYPDATRGEVERYFVELEGPSGRHKAKRVSEILAEADSPLEVGSTRPCRATGRRAGTVRWRGAVPAVAPPPARVPVHHVVSVTDTAHVHDDLGGVHGSYDHGLGMWMDEPLDNTLTRTPTVQDWEFDLAGGASVGAELTMTTLPERLIAEGVL